MGLNNFVDSGQMISDTGVSWPRVVITEHLLEHK